MHYQLLYNGSYYDVQPLVATILTTVMFHQSETTLAATVNGAL